MSAELNEVSAIRLNGCRKQEALAPPSSCLNLYLPTHSSQSDRNIKRMSCHTFALCIALPCPKRGLAETTFGERNFLWAEKTHYTPSKHQHLCPYPAWPTEAEGRSLRRAPSTSLPCFSQRRRSSALIPPQVLLEGHTPSKG